MKKLDYINRQLKIYQEKSFPLYQIDESLFFDKLFKKLEELPPPKSGTYESKTYMSIEHTIILMKRFLDQYACSLLPYFLTLLEEKRIIWEAKKNLNQAGFHQDRPFIRITPHYTLYDFIRLVHEFFHLTNQQFKKGETRDVLSEFLSIYFEKQAFHFLEQLNYDLEELSYFRRRRYTDTRYSIDDYHFEKTIFKVFLKEKEITIKNSPYKISVIYQYLYSHTFSPFKKMVYILGDVFSEYVDEKKINPMEVLKLNEEINNKTFFQALEELGICIDFSVIEEIFQIYLKNYRQIHHFVH